MNHRPSIQLSILRSLHIRPLEPIAGDEAIVAGTSSAGGLLIVVPEMGNAAAAGRAQYVRLEFRKILPGAILSQPANRPPTASCGVRPYLILSGEKRIDDRPHVSRVL